MTTEHEEKDEVVELTVYSRGGRFYQKSEEGEWVDVTEKWAKDGKEN